MSRNCRRVRGGALTRSSYLLASTEGPRSQSIIQRSNSHKPVQAANSLIKPTATYHEKNARGGLINDAPADSSIYASCTPCRIRLCKSENNTPLVIWKFWYMGNFQFMNTPPYIERSVVELTDQCLVKVAFLSVCRMKKQGGNLCGAVRHWHLWRFRKLQRKNNRRGYVWISVTPANDVKMSLSGFSSSRGMCLVIMGSVVRKLLKCFVMRICTRTTYYIYEWGS